MNKRIRELAIEAGYTTDMFGIGHWDMPECQKFAELIVKECAGLFPNVYVEIENEYGHTPVVAADYIKKHFGVE